MELDDINKLYDHIQKTIKLNTDKIIKLRNQNLSSQREYFNNFYDLYHQFVVESAIKLIILYRKNAATDLINISGTLEKIKNDKKIITEEFDKGEVPKNDDECIRLFYLYSWDKIYGFIIKVLEEAQAGQLKELEDPKPAEVRMPAKAEGNKIFKILGFAALIIIVLSVILYLVNTIINVILFLIMKKKNNTPSFWYIFAGPFGTYYFI